MRLTDNVSIITGAKWAPGTDRRIESADRVDHLFPHGHAGPHPVRGSADH